MPRDARDIIRTTSGDVTGFLSGSSTGAKSDSLYRGDTGSGTYTVGDIVSALKTTGVLKA